MGKFRFALPFLQTYYRKQKPFITISRVQTFLGNNFYPRLNSIYINICEAIAKKNYRYLSTYLEPSLSEKLISEINEVETERFKIKIKTPKAKIATFKPKKNFEKYLKFREKVWDNNQTKIGLTCNVYFGQQFKRENVDVESNTKKIKVGQFRYLIYNPLVSIFDNCLNWYKYQTFEFIIRYTSKIHLEMYSYDQRVNIGQNSTQDQEITTQIILKSGNEKFDYIVTDINALSSIKR